MNATSPVIQHLKEHSISSPKSLKTQSNVKDLNDSVRK